MNEYLFLTNCNQSRQLEEAIAEVGGWTYDGARGKPAWSPDSWSLSENLKKLALNYDTFTIMNFVVGLEQKNTSNAVVMVSHMR